MATVSKSLWGYLRHTAYLSTVSNDSITYTHPDRKLGIFCMKYFAGWEAWTGFVMKHAWMKISTMAVLLQPGLKTISTHSQIHTYYFFNIILSRHDSTKRQHFWDVCSQQPTAFCGTAAIKLHFTEDAVFTVNMEWVPQLHWKKTTQLDLKVCVFLQWEHQEVIGQTARES